ncbi:MAG: LysM peptidoglycan-binding domain-containing protein [Cyanobacteria bacterium TGS_CYA1]|nr:LysM peptidoglycan-binding domain-containing protein [Cyanobacteria bacterium TGS_CYA1]
MPPENDAAEEPVKKVNTDETSDVAPEATATALQASIKPEDKPVVVTNTSEVALANTVTEVNGTDAGLTAKLPGKKAELQGLQIFDPVTGKVATTATVDAASILSAQGSDALTGKDRGPGQATDVFGQITGSVFNFFSGKQREVKLEGNTRATATFDDKDRIISVKGTNADGTTVQTDISYDKDGNVSRFATPDKQLIRTGDGRYITVSNTPNVELKDQFILGPDGKPLQVTVDGKPQQVKVGEARYDAQNRLIGVGDKSITGAPVDVLNRLEIAKFGRNGVFSITDLDKGTKMQFDARTNVFILEGTATDLTGNRTVDSRVISDSGRINEVVRQNGDRVTTKYDEKGSLNSLTITDKDGKSQEWKRLGPNEWQIGENRVRGDVSITGDGTVTINDTVNNLRTIIGLDGKSEVRKIVGDTGEERVGYSVKTNDKGQVEQVVYQDRIYTANDGLKFNEQGNPYIDVPSPPGEAKQAGDTSRVTFVLKDDPVTGLKAGTRIEVNPKGTSVFDNGGRLMYRYAEGEQPGPNTQPREAYKYAQQPDGTYKVVEFNNGSGTFKLTDQKRDGLDVWKGDGDKEIVGNISVLNDGSLKIERKGPKGLETVYQTTMGTSIVTDSSGKREVQDARTNPPTVLVTETPTDIGTVIKIRDGAPPNGATYNYEKPSDQYPQGRFTYTDASGKEVTANGKVEIFADGSVRIENLDNFSTTRIEPTGESKTKFNRTGATVDRDRAGNVTETNDGKGNIRKYQYEIDEKTKQAKVTRVQEGDPMNGGQVWQLQPDGTWKSSRGDSFSGTMTVDRESGNRIVEDRTSKVMITESIADGTVKRENLENVSSQVLQGDKVQVSKDNRGQETQYYHGPDGRIDAVKLPDGRVVIRQGAPLNEIQSRDERFKSPTSLETATDISLTDSKLVVTNGNKLVETDLKTGSSFTYDTTPKDDGRPGRKLIEANIAIGGLDQPTQHLKFTADPSDPTKFVGQIDGKTWTGKFENGSLRLSNLELKQDRVYRPDGSYDITELGKEQRSYDTMNRLSGVLDLNTRIVKTLEYKGNDTIPSTVRILDANKNTETVWRRGNEGVVKDGVKVYQWKNMATDQTFEGPVTIENGKLTFLSDTSRAITQDGDKTTTIHPDGTTYVVGPNGVESWKSPNGQEIIFKTDSGMAGTVIGAITKVVHDGRTYTLNGPAKVDATGRLTYDASDDKECKVVKFTHNLDGTVEGKTPTGELIFAKGPGVNAAAVVGETLNGSKVEKVEPDTVSGGYKATLADGTIAYLRKDGSVIFEKQIGGATQTTERYEKTIVSADGTKTIKYTTTVPRRMEIAPFGMVYDVPDSYTETIRRKGGEDTVEWKRQADGTWLSSTGEKFNGVHGFLSTGELLKKESIPADPAKGQDALDKYTLNEHSGGIKDIYFTPDGAFKYGVFYDRFRRPAMITNPSERTTFTYDAAGEVKTLTVVNTQTNKSVTYTRGDDGRFRSADNPDGIKIQVNAATGMVTWSDYDGKKSVQSLADGSQVLEDGTRIEQSPNPEVKTRITKIDDKGNIIKTAGSIEVRSDGNVIYRDGTGKEYTYNPDSGNVFVTAPGAELIRFNGKITVDGKGNASIFNEETDRLTVVNVNGTLPQVLERQISQTYADGSSVTAIGGNKLVYKAPDGREITIDGRMDMVNDRPVITLTNPADYEKVKAFLEPKEGGSCPAEIKLANGAVVRPSLMKMNTLEYRYQGQIVEIPGTLTSDGKIQLSDTSKVDPAILAAIANPESGLPIARRVALSNGATIETDFSTPGRLIYTRNGVSTYINGTINQDTGKLDYSSTGLDENIKTALQNSSQTSELYWSKKGGVSESSYVSKDVILNVNPGSYQQVDGKITIPTGNGSIEYDASKPNKVVVNGTEYDGTIRIDNQGNLKVVLSTPSGKIDLSKIQSDSIKVLSTGDPPSKVDLASIGAPIVQQTRIQSSMESGTLTGYKPAPPAPELKGPGPVSLSSVSLLPASTDTKTDKVVVDPKAATLPSVDPALSLSRLMTGQPDKVYTGADLAAAQARTQQAVVQQTAVELRNTIERSMIANNLSEADRAVVRSALDSGDIPAAMAKLAGTPAGNVLADVDRAIKAVTSVFPPDTNPTKLAVAAVDNLNFTEALNRGRALSNNVTAYNQALQKYQATGDPAVLKGFVPDSTIAAIKAASVSLPKEIRDAAIANNLVTADIRSGRGSDLPSETAIVKTESLRSSGFLTVSERSEGPKVNELAASIVKKQEDLRVAAAYFEREVTRVQALPASEEQKRTLADLQVKLAAVQQERVQALAAEMKLTIPAALKEALGAEANTEAGKKYIEAVKAALNNPTSELAVKLVAAVIAMRREEILQREAAVLRETSNPGQVVNGVITPGSLATDRITVVPREVSATIRDVVTQTVEQLNLQARIPGAPPIDAVRAAELVRGIESNLLQAIRIAALNRSALDFLPSFQLTGDLSAFVKDTSAKPFISPITTMPIDLNVKYGSLTGSGRSNIITADGTMISIERAMANPALLAQLLATNQISINTLNGLLSSADLVRILNIAVAGGLSYTQITNLSNPELAKYFGTTVDGVKMGFNVQVGYASGLVYTSQNGVLVPARLNSLEDGIFIQSLQGQKTITEAIKSNSGFVTISNGKNRGDEDDDDEEDEEEEGVVVTGSKEDFGGKIPTAQPVTQTQSTASQDPTAVLASNQPVPLPDFLILPDGSMEPMPAEWKTKANHEHGHVDVIDENGKHVHVIDAKGNVLTEQQIEKAKQDVLAAKAAEAKAASTSTDFSPTAPEASLNVPLEIADFVANFGIENQGQAAYIDNDVNQTADANDPLSYINGLPIDSKTGFPYDPSTGYILNPTTGDIIGNINDQATSIAATANPFEGRLVDPITGFPYDPSTGILYDPLSGNPVGSVTPEADPIIDLSNDIAMIQDNVETRLDDISAYSHVQDALNDAQDIDDIHPEVASDLATRPEGIDFGTDEEYKEKEKERLDNILNQLEEEEKRLEEQEDELRKRRDEIERLTKLMNSLLATRRQAELDRIRRLIEQQRKIEEFIAKDIRRIKYTVRKGDTLENIAKKHFRDPRLARLIYEMNPAKIKLSQEEGKTAYQLTINSVLTLPSPRQAREWISRGKYLTAVDNSYVAQTELTADDLANMEKRRLNVESVLGALGMAADTNYKPTYTVRFGDSLRSIAMKHPALNDVSLWRLLAKVNDLSIETDAMGTPKATLERGANLNLPSKEEIAQFRKDNGALVHPSSLKQGASGPVDLVTNVTVFKECPSCKENTPSGVSLCHCCGFVFQETANGVGPETKISTVSKQVTLTNIGGASTEHDPLAPKQDKEDNVHTLNLPESERKVANSDVSPLPKTQVDPKGVPNVSPAAKADITLKLNDPLVPRVDTGITNTGANSDAFLSSMSSMQKSRKDSFSIPSHKYNMSKLVENLSDTSRIVLLDSELDSNNQKAERWQLEVLKDEEWTPVVAYEIIGDNSIRHEYNVTGKARKSIKMNLPSAAVEEMVRNDLSRNWQDYCQKFLTGKKLSQ